MIIIILLHLLLILLQPFLLLTPPPPLLLLAPPFTRIRSVSRPGSRGAITLPRVRLACPAVTCEVTRGGRRGGGPRGDVIEAVGSKRRAV
eukprot:2115840-Pyramimonas_sp.AAC.1